MQARLNIVTLGVKDLQKSSIFYQKTLGWKPTKDSDDKIVFFNQLGIVLGLYPLEELAKDAEISPDRSGFSGVTLAINLESKEAVDKLYHSIIEKGGKPLVEPRDTFWGATIVILQILMETPGKFIKHSRLTAGIIHE